jgi:hypothetical protein
MLWLWTGPRRRGDWGLGDGEGGRSGGGVGGGWEWGVGRVVGCLFVHVCVRVCVCACARVCMCACAPVQAKPFPWSCGRNEALRARAEAFVETVLLAPQGAHFTPGDVAHMGLAAVALPDAVAAVVPLWPEELPLAVLNSRTMAVGGVGHVPCPVCALCGFCVCAHA